ncbi:hypothetical protein ACLOJK_023626 [Asimina triloba]
MAKKGLHGCVTLPPPSRNIACEIPFKQCVMRLNGLPTYLTYEQQAILIIRQGGQDYQRPQPYLENEFSTSGSKGPSMSSAVYGKKPERVTSTKNIAIWAKDRTSILVLGQSAANARPRLIEPPTKGANG